MLVRPSAQVRVFVNLIVMEKNYNHKEGKETMDLNDGCVYFKNSELISGQLGKATLGRCELQAPFLEPFLIGSCCHKFNPVGRGTTILAWRILGGKFIKI